MSLDHKSTADSTRFVCMNPKRAVLELRALRVEADVLALKGPGPDHERWKASVSAVMQLALGRTADVLFKFQSVAYRPRFAFTGSDARERTARFFYQSVHEAAAFVDAAIFELGLMSEEEIDSSNYDEELWEHVKHSIDEERWEQVASAAATFVEDKVRRWAGNPLNENDGVLVGQALFAKVLGESGALALGGQSAETVGWRNLGIGFASALSNVDRHRIQKRPDLRRYAFGVLGLASLLLTQIRYAHPETVS